MILLVIFCIMGHISCSESANFPGLPNISDILQDQILVGALNPLSISKYGSIIPDALDPVFQLEDMTFNLFTKTNPVDAYPLIIGSISNLRSSPFKSQVSTKIIIHGWTDSADSSWMKDFRRNYLMTGDYNVICVGWFPASLKEYGAAAKLTRQIGDHIAELVNFLRYERNISLSEIHLLGHSLGAHIAGYTGSNFQGAIGRITGMDPARPLFEVPILKDVSDRLDAFDAMFVDVIHTCIGTVGFIRPIGHADFYPNGGVCTQPGCPVLVAQHCGHKKSYQYMIESIIHPEQFQAIKCLSWPDYKSGNCSENAMVTMGEYLSHDARGTFYLDTSTVTKTTLF